MFIINDLLKNLDTIWLGVIGSLVAAAIVFILNQVYSSVNRSIKISEIVERRIRDDEAEYTTAVNPSCPQASVYYGETPQSQPFYKGCMIQLHIENRNQKEISIAEFQMIIDQIQPFEKDEFHVIGDLKDDVFLLFAVNNGYTDIHNISIQLHGAYGRDYESSELASVFSCSINELQLTIHHLASGCIKRIGAFHIDVSELSGLSGSNNWLTVNASVQYDSLEEEYDAFIASLVYDDETGLYTVYYEGTGSSPVRYRAVIDTDGTLPVTVDLPGFVIESNSAVQVHVLTLIYHTNTIQYHFEIKAAGKRKIITETRTVSIYVPVYVTDDGNFDSVREWLLKNDVYEYAYNSKPLLQKEIEFKYNYGLTA